jgi:hypothetical protein
MGLSSFFGSLVYGQLFWRGFGASGPATRGTGAACPTERRPHEPGLFAGEEHEVLRDPAVFVIGPNTGHESSGAMRVGPEQYMTDFMRDRVGEDDLMGPMAVSGRVEDFGRRKPWRSDRCEPAGWPFPGSCGGGLRR